MGRESLVAVQEPAAGTAAHEHDRDEGHGRRLTAAFEALETFPVLVESRNRVIALFDAGAPSRADLVAAVEGDVALAVAVLRLANRIDGPARGSVESAVQAVGLLSCRAVRAIVSRARTFDFFEPAAVWYGAPESFRLHAVATQRAADRLARELAYEPRDRLMVTSLLHDVGKLVLMHAYPGYPTQIHGDARTPEDRLARERRELGVDHGLVGGVLARRWGLPQALATVIERHHADGFDQETALVRLADMLAHHTFGGDVSPSELLAAGASLGLPPAGLRTVMYDLPLPGSDRRRRIGPCPLSSRELGVLQRLARGAVYKQIAVELGLATSTVRTHLHNVYGKLGVMDRAQAVLIATERGWI
jgi:putative nucleotidyltransferase with HDIG domain